MRRSIISVCVAVAALGVFAATASAHVITIASTDVTCAGATIKWTSFPGGPFNVNLAFQDQVNGKAVTSPYAVAPETGASGSAFIPAPAGPGVTFRKVTATWTVDGGGSVSASAYVHCESPPPPPGTTVTVTTPGQTVTTPGQTVTVTNTVTTTTPGSTVTTPGSTTTVPGPTTTNTTTVPRPGVIVPTRTKMALTKHANVSVVKPGGEVRFTIRWRNTGKAPVKNLVLCDNLPSGMTFAAAPGATFKNGKACWSEKSVGVGSKLTFVVIAKVDVDAGAKHFVNTAVARASNAPTAVASAKVRSLPQRGTHAGGVTG